MAISFPKDRQQQLIRSIQRFFRENLEEDIGELRASLVLDFFLKEIGPSVYNKAVADAQVFLQEKVLDLDGSCYEPEHVYWKR